MSGPQPNTHPHLSLAAGERERPNEHIRAVPTITRGALTSAAETPAHSAYNTLDGGKIITDTI